MKLNFYAISVAIILISCANRPDSADKNSKSNQTSAKELQSDTIIDFENQTPGKVPVNFVQSSTGKVQKLNWVVISDNGNKAVAQMAANEGDYYNLLFLDNIRCLNFKLSSKIKAVKGNEDQGGGLVWHYIDNNNYYIARYNPLETNFRLYKVVNGNRKQLKSVEVNIKSKEWFTMEIEMNGNKISCSLNGQKQIDFIDETFPNSGKIGFWTKADAQTYFDELSILPLHNNE